MKLEINNKVLVPIDYSEFCANSLKYALTLFDPDQIEVIHVAHIPAPNSPGVIWEQVSESTVRKHCTKSFEEFCEKYNLPDNLNFTVEVGSPAERIASFAIDKMVGLVLISSHGRKGIARWFLGSVAERVVRLATCPVLVVKPDEIIDQRKRRLAKGDAMVRSMFEPAEAES